MEKCACKSRTPKDSSAKECGCKSGKKKKIASHLLFSSKIKSMNIHSKVGQLQDLRIEEANQTHRVVKIDELANSTYILRLEKNGRIFRSGQYVALNVPNDIQSRHYSIYSSEQNETLDFLIKEVDNGTVSSALHKLNVGDKIIVDGPWGHFRLKPSDVENKKFLFIASGTGISPFHSFIKSHTNLNYKLIHGVRYGNERYEMNEYPKKNYISCTSRDKQGDFHGRVTDYLKSNPVEQGTLCYLCGNNLMIDDVHAILRSQGISNSDIFAEIFF